MWKNIQSLSWWNANWCNELSYQFTHCPGLTISSNLWVPYFKLAWQYRILHKLINNKQKMLCLLCLGLNSWVRICPSMIFLLCVINGPSKQFSIRILPILYVPHTTETYAVPIITYICPHLVRLQNSIKCNHRKKQACALYHL